MAFKDTSGTIIIDAVITDIGRKKLARGNLTVTKFCLGDDEIDYSTYDAEKAEDAGYHPELTGSKIFEAYGSKSKNIQYGLFSKDQSKMPNENHANIFYLPILALNDKVDVVPEMRGGFYYLSVNNETTSKVNEIFSNTFRFLSDNDVEKTKVVIESGLTDTYPYPAGTSDNPFPDDIPESKIDEYYSITPIAREYFLEKKYLIDRDFYVYVDNRFLIGVIGTSPKSVFKNFKNGESQINLEPLRTTAAVSLENQFEHYATYLVRGIKNMMFDFDVATPSRPSAKYSSLGGPKGSVMALNFTVNGYLKNNSTEQRDFRYTEYGEIDQLLFDSTHKFDYIETCAYIQGTSSGSRIRVPMRLIRYSGT